MPLNMEIHTSPGAAGGGVKVSIIICTLNRCNSLQLTLDSIAAASVPKGWTVELLVVDNGSTDNTSTVVANSLFMFEAPRYIREPTPGLSNARNTGLKRSIGEVILFTDDDVRVPKDWISGMCEPILENECDAVAGGVIFPPDINKIFSKRPLSRLRSWYASSHEIDRERPGRLIGANMSFARHVLAKVSGFDSELGAGGTYKTGEETLFSGRLIKEGFRIGTCLDVSVEHHFDTRRLAPETILAQARQIGLSDGYISWHLRHKKHRHNRLKLALLRGMLFVASPFTKAVTKVRGMPPYWEVAQTRKIAYREAYFSEQRKIQKY